MTAILHRITGKLQVPHTDARLLQLTNNAVFALPQPGIVIRISRTQRLRDRADKVAALGIWFTATNAATIRLTPGIDQPVLVDDFAATIWDYIPPTPPEPTIEDLGHVLQHFHRIAPPPFDLPAWDPVGDARRRITDAEGLSEHDHDYLLTWCDQLAPQVDALRDTAPPTLIHGDAHTGNLLRTPDGGVVLCDFDATSLGPWQVDLTAVPVGEARFGRHGAHRRLATAYGRDVTTDPAWPVLRQARELKMIAAAAPLLRSTPGITDEFALRLRTVQDRDSHARWTPFADLQR
ncbi:phosphotransferase [Polymorphospora sp. NPDC050346]|uniref:phosphotransferase family protein n=1 Tax=Polymorphospora sp. NPDC050346 TaxID=3155780 RepID=UPI0033FC3A1F